MSAVTRKVRYTVDRRTYEAVLRYTADRPYDVRADFGPGSDGKGPVVWTFARDLLRDGLAGLAGRGDMQCWTEEPYYYVALSSPHGEATARFYADSIRGFLIDAEDLVPYGAERIDFDAELDALIGGGRGA